MDAVYAAPGCLIIGPTGAAGAAVARITKISATMKSASPTGPKGVTWMEMPLDRAVHTGTHCAYVPDPGAPAAWMP
jgi:hypothetical protein